MATLNQIKLGVANYIEAEILPKIGGWQKWVIGAAVSMALNRSDALYEQLRANPVIQTLGVIDNDGYIDIDTLYGEVKKQAQKNSISFEVPMVGKLTLNETDVDKIYNYIKGVSA